MRSTEKSETITEKESIIPESEFRPFSVQKGICCDKSKTKPLSALETKLLNVVSAQNIYIKGLHGRVKYLKKQMNSSKDYVRAAMGNNPAVKVAVAYVEQKHLN